MMKKLFLLLALASQLCFGATTTFSPDTTTTIQNTERSWYVLAGNNGLLSTGTSFRDDLISIRDSFGFRLALAETALPTVVTTANTNTMTSQFAVARTQGLKLILRFECGTSNNCDPSLAQVQAQTQAIRPILLANRDIIAYIQAGFLGAYGEWAEVTNGNDSKANKRTIKDYIMAMAPKEIPILFTQVYPPQEDWFAGLGPIQRPQAFNGSPMARLGFHSDCFLTGNGDSFFYPGPTTVSDFTITSTRLQERNYVAAYTEYVPFITETCIGSQGANQQMRTQCTGLPNDGEGLSGGIMNEGPRYHLTSMNNTYAPNFIQSWKDNGCYKAVGDMMGFRFQYGSLSHPDAVGVLNGIRFTLSMRNYGWSRIFLERHVVITLTKSGAPDIVCGDSDDLRTLPSQATSDSTISVVCTIPGTAPAGIYAVFLSMPDNHGSLAGTRIFTVQPANSFGGAQVWDNTLGRLSSGTTVQVFP